LQSGSEHPLARAVVDAARAKGLAVDAPEDVRAVPGRGLEGEWKGRSFLIGSRAWFGESWEHPSLPAEATVSALVERTTDGLTLRALMAFADEPKPTAAAAIAQLRTRGLRLRMISGDNQAAAAAMAARLGLREDEVLANVLPADKAAAVARLKEGGHVVAMVGDGVNDAPALAAADVGIAMGNGADVAMHAAGVTLMRGDVSLVAGALDVSHRTVRKIRQNLFWAFAYNVAGIPLAALGFLNPVVAGAAMALSSVSVMANALLLRRWHGRD
jgi:P-type Cu+ transporter